MSRTVLFAIVEGQTENAVLGRLLGNHLGAKGIDLHCPIVKLGAGRGGVKGLKCEDLCDQIQRHLKDRRQPYVTTFFDFYALPMGEKAGWGFVEKAKSEGFLGLDITVQLIERELHRLVVECLDIPAVDTRFIPYIQLHELEALFFAEPETAASVFGDSSLARILKNAVTECGGCENINDTPQQAPSKRITAAFPGYIKGRSDFAHGPRIASKLVLETVRQACPHFSDWVSKLEALAPTAPPTDAQPDHPVQSS